MISAEHALAPSQVFRKSRGVRKQLHSYEEVKDYYADKHRRNTNPWNCLQDMYPLSFSRVHVCDFSVIFVWVVVGSGEPFLHAVPNMPKAEDQGAERHAERWVDRFCLRCRIISRGRHRWCALDHQENLSYVDASYI